MKEVQVQVTAHGRRGKPPIITRTLGRNDVNNLVESFQVATSRRSSPGIPHFWIHSRVFVEVLLSGKLIDKLRQRVVYSVDEAIHTTRSCSGSWNRSTDLSFF